MARSALRPAADRPRTPARPVGPPRRQHRPRPRPGPRPRPRPGRWRGHQPPHLRGGPVTDHLPTGQARELLEAHKGQRVRVEQHTLGGDLVIEVGYLHYEQETRTWGIRDAVVTYPAAD